MKKALLAIALAMISASVCAQGTTDGKIIFQTINISVSPGATSGGGNGNGTYNVPLYQAGTVNTPAGLLTGGVTVGLFLSSNLNTPLVVGQLGTATGTAPYVFTPSFSQNVTVTGHAPGELVNFTVRAWQGSSFASAQGGAGQWGEWAFTSTQLGGTPPSGSPIQTPTMTGWGPTDNSGFHLVPEPATVALGVLGIGALALARRRK